VKLLPKQVARWVVQPGHHCGFEHAVYACVPALQAFALQKYEVFADMHGCNDPMCFAPFAAECNPIRHNLFTWLFTRHLLSSVLQRAEFSLRLRHLRYCALRIENQPLRNLGFFDLKLVLFSSAPLRLSHSALS
jgi:hypothetical protein